MNSGEDSQLSRNEDVPTQGGEERKPEFHGPQNYCFGCGPINPVGLKLVFQTTDASESGHGHTVRCEVVISELYEGPPGYLHGGIIATLLDEAMSKANRAQGVTAMTRQMQVEYLRPVPSNTPVLIVGRVARSDGRKHWTSGEIQNLEGTILASATGLFIAIDRM